MPPRRAAKRGLRALRSDLDSETSSSKKKEEDVITELEAAVNTEPDSELRVSPRVRKVAQVKVETVVPVGRKGKSTPYLFPLPTELRSHAQRFPDVYFRPRCGPGVQHVSGRHQLRLLKCLSQQGQIMGMCWSSDGELLCGYGSLCIWDVTTLDLLQELRDPSQQTALAEEFYVALFIPGTAFLVAGGKMKDRRHWSQKDDDLQCMPTALKVFDLDSGQIVQRLDGHTEEIYDIHYVEYRNVPYLLSCGEDGIIFKWQLDLSNWEHFAMDRRLQIADGISCAVYGMEMIPNTGSRFFVAATDTGIRVYDFEKEMLIGTYQDLFTGACDCVHSVRLVDFDPSIPLDMEPAGSEEQDKLDPLHAFFLIRGTEEEDADSGTKFPNQVKLVRLQFPREPSGSLSVRVVSTYQDKSYESNSLLVRIASNGRVVACPTSSGDVVFFNLRTRTVELKLRDHGGPIRDMLFHSSRDLLATCGDDGNINVWEMVPSDTADQELAMEDPGFRGENNVEDDAWDKDKRKKRRRRR